MTDTPIPASMWARTYQVAVVVRDIDQARAFYERLGIGPFVEGPSASARERRIHGRLVPDAAVRGAVAPMGAIELELLQPVSGDTIQAEFLRTHGEGVIHICAYTDDLARDTALLRSLGHEPISEAVLEDGGSFAYFDTRQVGGLILELFQPGSDWR
jgi:catechol 2,3-dioxygenase-like lactoylglutathione lyase family enzyme